MRQKRTYGRHGSNAWLRWYKRRFRHRSLVLPPTSNSGNACITCVHLPIAHEERVIIIMVFNQSASGDIWSSDLLPGHDPFYLLKYYAGYEANKKAKEDLVWDQTVSDEELRLYAESLWDQYVRQTDIVAIATTNRKSATDLFEIYEEELLLQYHKIVEEKGKSVPDDDTWDIQKIARADQRDFGKSLSPTHIPYLAVVRAQQHLSLGSSVDSTYLDQIANYVRVYEEAYRRYLTLPPKERL